MSRFYDRIMVSNIRDETKALLRTAIVFKIDNVVDYYFQGTEKETWDILNDFPNLAPPFKNFFIESKTPKYIKSEKTGFTDIRTLSKLFPMGLRTKSFGIHIIVDDAQDISKETKCQLEMFKKVIRFKKENFIDVKWLITAFLYMELTGQKITEPFAYVWMAVNKDGSVQYLGSREEAYVFALLEEGHKINFDLESTSRLEEIMSLKFKGRKIEKIENMFVGGSFFPAFLAISFMHCKNVTTEEIIPPEKLNKKFKKRHRKELIRYHVLKIEPMRKILKTEGKSDELGIPKALHICRGHFKDYRQSGLFGKIPGIFWWESHVRGQKEKGIILKDYEINKPTFL